MFIEQISSFAFKIFVGIPLFLKGFSRINTLNHAFLTYQFPKQDGKLNVRLGILSINFRMDGWFLYFSIALITGSDDLYVVLDLYLN